MDKNKDKPEDKKKIVLKTPDFRKEKMESVEDALQGEDDKHLKGLIHLPVANGACCC
jgi:hypothetical protein